MHHTFIASLILLTISTVSGLKADQPRQGIRIHKALPKPGGEPNLRAEVVMKRKVWGVWESPKFDYRIVNEAKKPIAFQNGDMGRGFAGKLMYLPDPKGKVQAFGEHWAEPLHYRPNFLNNPTTVKPGASLFEMKGLQPSGYFGPLAAGNYSVQVVVPPARMTVDGKLTLQMSSVPIDFRVSKLTQELRKKLETTPEDRTGVTVKPVKRIVKTTLNNRSVKLRILNKSKAKLRFSQYIGMKLVPTEVECFGGDGTWRKKTLGWCGTGMGIATLLPGQTAEIVTQVPLDTGRFVRFGIRVEEAGKSRTVGSSVVEVIHERQ